MVDVRLLLKFINRTSVTKILLTLLLIALFPIFDCWLLVFICIKFPLWYNLILASFFAIGLLGFNIIFFIIRRELNEIKFMIKNGIYPEKQFNKLTGSFICTWFCVSPGILTSCAAFFLFFPIIKGAVGKLITKRISNDIKEVYDYIKLYEIEI